MVTGIDKLLLPGGQWFERDDERVCYLSDVAAAELGIDARSVGKRPVEILLAGWPIRVAGVFDSASLENLTDFDDVTLLPETKGLFTTWQQTRARTQQAVGRPGVKAVSTSYISSATMVILPYDVRLYSGESDLCTSIVLLFKDLPYGTIRETINDMMDSSLTFLSYALEGLGYFGGKYRLAGLEAIVDMIVPLLIASFIVFNTMLGSVYERQKEISVYSAVGLSPRHVFYLFLAESLVYAVIGVVGGYLLALGLQWLSHGSGDLLKLNINHSSSSAIYVTVTLMMAVILSSLIPARQAARIASPSEPSPGHCRRRHRPGDSSSICPSPTWAATFSPSSPSSPAGSMSAARILPPSSRPPCPASRSTPRNPRSDRKRSRYSQWRRRPGFGRMI